MIHINVMMTVVPHAMEVDILGKDDITLLGCNFTSLYTVKWFKPRYT